MFASLRWGLSTFVLALAVGTPASAQYFPRPAKATVGETYTVEFAILDWKPEPDILIRTESVNILGTPIDLVNDLGIDEGHLPDFRFVLRAARKHKFRVSFVPIHYSAESLLERTIVFNGTTYRFGLPITSDFEWKAWRFGYEYDFIARDRGYVGFIVEAKYTDVKLDMAALTLSESATASVPIPAVGGAFRVYPARYVSISGEVSGMKLPGSLSQGDDTADYLDWDLYAIVNFGRYAGAQVGYRTIDMNYRYNREFGNFKVKGPYFGGVVRF